MIVVIEFIYGVFSVVIYCKKFGFISMLLILSNKFVVGRMVIGSIRVLFIFCKMLKSFLNIVLYLFFCLDLYVVM